MNDLLRFSGNRHLGGEGEKKKYFKETNRVVNEFALEIIIFRHFYFFL